MNPTTTPISHADLPAVRDYTLQAEEDRTVRLVAADRSTMTVRVYACPALPGERGHLSLRDLAGREVAVITTLAEVDAASRRTLEACLMPAGRSAELRVTA